MLHPVRWRVRRHGRVSKWAGREPSGEGISSADSRGRVADSELIICVCYSTVFTRCYFFFTFLALVRLGLVAVGIEKSHVVPVDVTHKRGVSRWIAHLLILRVGTDALSAAWKRLLEWCYMLLDVCICDALCISTIDHRTGSGFCIGYRIPLFFFFSSLYYLPVSPESTTSHMPSYSLAVHVTPPPHPHQEHQSANYHTASSALRRPAS